MVTDKILQEVKKRFPIGCYYSSATDSNIHRRKLLKDECTYEIRGNYIWAHSGGGCLYKDGQYAILVDENDLPIQINNEPQYEIY